MNPYYVAAAVIVIYLVIRYRIYIESENDVISQKALYRINRDDNQRS